MVRVITGLCTMFSGENVYIRDGEGPVAHVFVGASSRLLTPDEMRHLAHYLNEAAERADDRELEQATDTSEDEQKDS